MLLLLLDDLTPEWFLTFFRLDMVTGRCSPSLGLAAHPLSAWCLEWACTTWKPSVGAISGIGAGTRLPLRFEKVRL